MTTIGRVQAHRSVRPLKVVETAHTHTLGACAGNNHVGQLLVGRLVFTPRKDETGRYYEFVGQGSISEVVCGAVLPKEWWPQRDVIELARFKCAIS